MYSSLLGLGGASQGTSVGRCAVVEGTGLRRRKLASKKRVVSLCVQAAASLLDGFMHGITNVGTSTCTNALPTCVVPTVGTNFGTVSTNFGI